MILEAREGEFERRPEKVMARVVVQRERIHLGDNRYAIARPGQVVVTSPFGRRLYHASDFMRLYKCLKSARQLAEERAR